MDAGDSVPRTDGEAVDTDRPPGAGGGDVRWKMRRGDGSEWTVTDLSLAPGGLRVSGYRYVRDRDAPAESRREVLDGELLGTDDRVWCLDRSGSVVWRLTSPGRAGAPGGDDDAGPSTGPAFPGTPGSRDAGTRAGRGGAPPGGGGPTGG